MGANNCGATPGAWEHFSGVLGLTEHLLPVAADSTAKISTRSTLRQAGKVPSSYDQDGRIVGFAKWTEHTTTAEEVKRWSKNLRLGVCLRTAEVRALDVDISDALEARAVHHFIAASGLQLPTRTRVNSPKFLHLFCCPGAMPKRVIKTKHGMIEFLGSGQQCVIESTHPSGARYEWSNGWPAVIPTLTLEQFNALWNALQTKFGIEPASTATVSTRKEKIAAAVSNDPTVNALNEQGLILQEFADGKLAVICPFDEGHTPGSAITSTVYFPEHTGGYERGHFDCKHASCAHREDADFREQIGMRRDGAQEEDTDFAELPIDKPDSKVKKVKSFDFVPAGQFAAGANKGWWVKKVWPVAELAMIYAESGGGKSFFVLDMLCAVAQGVAWRGLKTKQASVAYICAEGAGGMRNRVKAYAKATGFNLDDIKLFILGDAPNFLEKVDVDRVLAGLARIEGLGVVVVDTTAAVMAGGDENSGKDMGRIIANCKRLHHDNVNHPLVCLIHHSGKDAAKGARGWSGIRAACDAEMEIVRDGHSRIATVTKMKDGEDYGLEFGFCLKTVDLDVQDEDGDTVSSCVVEEVILPPKGERKVSASSGESDVLDWVEAQHALNGEWPGRGELHAQGWGKKVESLIGKNQLQDVDGVIELL